MGRPALQDLTGTALAALLLLGPGLVECGALFGVDFDDARASDGADGGDERDGGASNGPGERGDGGTRSSDGGRVLPDVAPGEAPWVPVELSADAWTTCQAQAGARVVCWESPQAALQKPAVVPGLGPGVVSVAVGALGVCVLRTTGAVLCTDRKTEPVAVSGLESGVRALSASDGIGCAVRANGRVACWGTNRDGRLGNGSMTAHSPVAVDVAGITDAPSVSAGFDHACALLADGTVRCWGANESGQLGDGTFETPRLAAVRVKDLTGVKRIAAGTSVSCAVLDDGAVRCWGARGDSLFPSQTNDVSSPLAIAGIDEATEVDVGDNHVCVLRKNGSVSCFGRNTFGQLGGGTTNPRGTPALVRRSNGATMSGATAVNVGFSHGCVILDGSVSCWGGAVYGALAVAVAPDTCVVTTNPYPCSLFPVTAQTGGL